MESREQEAIHWAQRLMENVWFLLAVGIGVPTVMYTAWGMVDLVILPLFGG